MRKHKHEFNSSKIVITLGSTSVILLILFLACLTNTSECVSYELKTPPDWYWFGNKSLFKVELSSPIFEKSNKAIENFTEKNKKTHPMKMSVKRNVLIVGKTRVGKTKLINHLFNSNSVANDDPALVVGTKHPTPYSLSYTQDDVDYALTLIDTPGLMEQAMKTNGRAEEHISYLIINCMLSQVTTLNKIYYVIENSNYIGDDDKRALTFISNLFKSAQKSIKIIVTKSQRWNARQEKLFLEQLSNIPNLPESIDIKNVLFHGLVLDQDLEDDISSLTDRMTDRVNQLRDNIIQDIIKSEQYIEMDLLAYSDPFIELLTHKVRLETIQNEELKKLIRQRYVDILKEHPELSPKMENIIDKREKGEERENDL
jgi:GTPase Era involved in 16S rRNA processing